MWNKPIPLFASWTVFVGCICSCFRCSDCFSSVVCWSTCDPTSRVFVLPCFPPVERSSAGLPLPLLLPGRPTLSSIINESQPRITAEPQCCIYCTVGLFTQTSCDVALSVFLPLSVLSWGLFFFPSHLSLKITEDLINGNSAFEGEIITAGTLTIKLLLSFHHFLQLMSYLNWVRLLFFSFFPLHHIINSSRVAQRKQMGCPRSVIFHSQAAQAVSE